MLTEASADPPVASVETPILIGFAEPLWAEPPEEAVVDEELEPQAETIKAIAKQETNKPAPFLLLFFHINHPFNRTYFFY